MAGPDVRDTLAHIFQGGHVTLPVPGEMNLFGDGIVGRLRCSWDPVRSLARLVVDAGVEPDRLVRLNAPFPLLCTGPNQSTFLLRSHSGVAEWRADVGAEYAVRLPKTEAIGDFVAYEAVSLEPELVPSFSTGSAVLHRRTVVPSGPFEIDAFENASRDVQLAVRSTRESDAGACALVSVRSQHDDADPELLAIPLTWLRFQRVASGSLTVGRLGDGVGVFVVPELVSAAEVHLSVLVRSLERIANAVTRTALRRIIEHRTGDAG
jgi:hypothetical protein